MEPYKANRDPTELHNAANGAWQVVANNGKHPRPDDTEPTPKKTKTATIHIELTNRYAPLTTTQQNEMDTETAPEIKETRPPPIVLQGRVQHNEMVKSIKEIIGNVEFHITYRKDETNVQFKRKIDYETFIYKIPENTKFFTYTPKDKKTRAIIIKGLPDDLNEEDLLAEAAESNLGITKIMKLTKTRYPIYMALTNSKKSIAELNKHHKYLQHTKINWERYQNKRLIIQCKNCQRWGHATANCRLNARCVKCAGDHATRECKKSRDVDAKCVNCSGAHTACDTECPVYVKLAETRKNKGRTTTPKQVPRPAPRHLPAPPPTTNIWDERRKQHARSQAATEAPATAPSTSARPTRPEPPAEIRFDHKETISATRPLKTTHEQGANRRKAELSDLVGAITELDSLINIDLMFERVTKLNTILRTCRNETERFQTFCDFYKTLDGKN